MVVGVVWVRGGRVDPARSRCGVGRGHAPRLRGLCKEHDLRVPESEPDPACSNTPEPAQSRAASPEISALGTA